MSFHIEHHCDVYPTRYTSTLLFINNCVSVNLISLYLVSLPSRSQNEQYRPILLSTFFSYFLHNIVLVSSNELTVKNSRILEHTFVVLIGELPYVVLNVIIIHHMYKYRLISINKVVIKQMGSKIIGWIFHHSWVARMHVQISRILLYFTICIYDTKLGQLKLVK